jgi:hypothetical protein
MLIDISEITKQQIKNKVEELYEQSRELDISNTLSAVFYANAEGMIRVLDMLGITEAVLGK